MKREYELLFLCLGLTLVILGTVMQYKVIINNNCRMPVLDSPNAEDSERHFNYLDKSEIEYWYLSDIIGVENERISIGDILIWMGYILILAFSIRYLIKCAKEEKRE